MVMTRTDLQDAADRTARFLATIPSGAALSDAGDLRGYRIDAIRMPPSWTTAALAFSESDTAGGAYQPVQNISGGIAGAFRILAEAGKVYRIGAILDPFRYLQVRSVDPTTGAAVNQAEERQVVLLAVPI
jgi:hypothetical protein